MSAAVAAILEGMPEPRDLRLHEHDGRCVITAGRVVLFEYAAGDVVMRNIALAALRQLGFRGRVVAAVLGLTENYVATLHNAALRDGSAALVMQDRLGRDGHGLSFPMFSVTCRGCGCGAPMAGGGAGWMKPQAAAAVLPHSMTTAGAMRGSCANYLRLVFCDHWATLKECDHIQD